MSLSAQLRRAAKDDLPRLNALMKSVQAYQGAYGVILENYALGGTQLHRDQIFLAEAGGDIRGFYSLIVTGEPELDLMFVADAAQGTGLGKILFDHMRETARSHGIASVLIVSHPPSVRFYERMGAVRDGMKPPSGRVTWERPILRLAIG
jgi:GNAT superfamily N-acetyltransferase